jgi:hypothetical protein
MEMKIAGFVSRPEVSSELHAVKTSGTNNNHKEAIHAEMQKTTVNDKRPSHHSSENEHAWSLKTILYW